MRHAGVEAVTLDRVTPNDVVVASLDDVDAALAGRPSALLLLGPRRSRRLAAAQLRTTRILALPDARSATLLLPLERPAVVRTVVRWVGRGRRSAGAVAAPFGAALPSAMLPGFAPRLLTMASRSTTVPFALGAGLSQLGEPAPEAWALLSRPDDALRKRAIFVAGDVGAAYPRWIVKAARTPAQIPIFVAESHGFAAAADAGPVVSDRVPNVRRTLAIDGGMISIESAVPGRALADMLREPRSEREKLELVVRVTRWLADVSTRTALPASVRSDADRRLRDVVLPAWRPYMAHVAGDEILGPLERVPTVFEHYDLFPANILFDGDALSVVDLETARRHGFPLWDALVFLTSSLAIVAGALRLNDQFQFALELYRGKHALSPHFARLLQEVATSASIPSNELGALATACLLDYAIPHRPATSAALEPESPAVDAVQHLLEAGRLPTRIAAAWLADPQLGVGWRRN